MAYAFIAENSGQSGDQNTVTSGNIDSSGATLLWAVVVGTGDGTGVGISDSKGNTWTTDFVFTATVSAQVKFCAVFSCANPGSVGASHNASSSGTTAMFPAISFMAFSGTVGALPEDQSSGGSASAQSAQPGSITPAFNNEVVLTGAVSGVASTTPSVDSSFVLKAALTSTANAQAIGSAYLIQTSAAAVNPTWSGFTTAQGIVCVQVSYKEGVTASGRMFQVF